MRSAAGLRRRLGGKGGLGQAHAARGLDDFLRALGEALLACAWARSEVAARMALEGGQGDRAFYEAKLQGARFQADYLGGEVARHLACAERARAELPFLPAS